MTEKRLYFHKGDYRGKPDTSSMCMRGTDLEDFIAGVMTGVGCGSILVGVYVISRTFRK